MNWMVKWAGAFPPFVREAQGRIFLMWMGTGISIFVWAIRGQ